MIIKLFKIKKRINSTYTPSTGVEIEAKYKNVVSIFSPVLIVNKKYVGYNYLKINDYYYYINDIIHLNNDNIELYCNIDYLSSFKNDIINTTAYVNYSSSVYDDRIVDSRFSTVAEATFKQNESLLIDDGDEFGTGGSPTYLLNYATDNATVGATGFSWTTGATANEISKILNDQGFNTFLKQNEKQLQGAYDCILSCKKIPMAWHLKGVSSSNIHLGGYETKIKSIIPVPIKYETNVSIPWQFSDFRNLEPYTSLFVFLPNYGFVSLNPNDFIGKDSINIKLVCDPLTGDGVYIAGNIYRATCNFATDFQIGTSKNNVNGVMNGLMTSIGGAMVKNPMGVVSGIVNTVISSNERNFGVVGGISSSTCCKVSVGDWRKVYCITICHNTNQEPSSVVNTLGLNTKKVLSLKDLRGYVQTENASVSSINEKINNKLNNFLNGGIYIE